MEYSFAYNGFGDRLQQTADAVTTNYTLDLNTGLTQVLADGATTYLYGLSRIGEYDGEAWLYHLPDALGSLRQIADATGAITHAQSFAPYGEVANEFGEQAGNYGFAGEWTDPSGLVYLRARYYDPSTGLFLQPDPFVGYANLPASYHPYQYTFNNPVLYTDPRGEFPQIIAIGALGAVIGGIGGWIFAKYTYDWAYSGQCGCEMQQWAMRTDRGKYIKTTAGIGALIGGIASAVVATGPAAAVWVGRIGVGVSSIDALRTTWRAAARGGFTKCDVLRLTVDILGIIGSARLLKSSAQVVQGGGSAGNSTWPSYVGGRKLIDGIIYSKHALQRMEPPGLGGRGIPPSVVKNAITFGKITPTKQSGVYAYTYEQIVVWYNVAQNVVVTVFKTGRR